MTINGETIFALLEKRGAYPAYCSRYGEEGYDDPEKSIIFADWNHVSKRVYSWLESHGYALEWSDEWIIPYQTDKAYRSSPDGYDFKPSYFITVDGDVIGKDEIESGDEIDTYIEYLKDDANRCDTFDVDWTKHGFTKLNDDSYESGLHPGQNDSPAKILRAAQSSKPDHDFIFSLDETSQFYSTFSIWSRPSDYEA